MMRNSDLQFPATVLEMKRAGERWRAASDPETQRTLVEVLTMPFGSHYRDSVRTCNPMQGAV
jgi:hypothetical protein